MRFIGLYFFNNKIINNILITSFFLFNILADHVEKFFVLTARNFGLLCQTKSFLIQLGYADLATRPSQQMSKSTVPYLQNPR